MGFAFDLALADPSLVTMSDEQALADLYRVRRWWLFGRLRRLTDSNIGGMEVLLRGGGLSRTILQRHM